MRIGPAVLLAAATWHPAVATAQEGAALAQAERAYQELEYGRAISEARLALSRTLERGEQVRAWELIALSYAVLDSAALAIAAFQQLTFLDPDYRPDPDRVSPRIVTLHALAVSQQLVVRDLSVDSAVFIEGEGTAEIRFSVSRPAAVSVSISGRGREDVIRRDTVAGDVVVRWSALTAEGEPAAAGVYQVIVLATEGRNRDERSTDVRVTHEIRDDTLPLLDSLPGYQPRPESEIPDRDFTPLLGTIVSGALLTAAVFSLTEQDARTEALYARPELVAINLWALASGLILSLRQPEPRPVQANIFYNRFLREELARRNDETRQENYRRRQQVRIRVERDDGP